MSSRALRRLQQDAAVIRVPASSQESDGGGDEEDGIAVEGPGFNSSKSRKPAANPFAMLVEDGEGEGGDSEDEQGENASPVARTVSDGSSNKKKKKRKKKSKQTSKDQTEQPQAARGGEEDVDAVIREVNELLGETPVRGAAAAATNTSSLTAAQKSLLSVDKRFLNADNEMRRIFGARVVRAEGGQGRRRSHRRSHHRSTFLATPKDTWPSMEKPGLSMQLDENKDGCQYFVFEHSQDYQKIQFRFWDAVETFDPEAIVEVLHAHPYHIDSLLQLSEVCKMSEDIQMATELIERALYCFECNLHALFNFSQGNCRLSYSRAENRPFFIALFRHLSYVGRKGCHRTALEFCKLLLGLEPSGDPLCCLLMIDYFAVRAGEYSFLLDLFNAWEGHRNLSQLPNFAFSTPLALFHSSTTTARDIRTSTSDDPVPSQEADRRLQDALLMFPSMLLPLMEKCSVNLDPRVAKHSFFADAELSKDPSSLQLLVKLYIERSHSLWKEPEVLTWLEENSRQVVARVDAKDSLVADYARKRQKRYIGTPRNIYRHVIMSDFDQVAATLPRDLSDSPILMYDPLPPLDSTSGYSRPQRQHRVNILREDENPFLLFLRSLLPTFNHEGDGGRLGDAGDHPNPAVRQLQAQLAAARAQRNPRQPQPGAGGNEGPEVVGGAVGGIAPPNPEGQPGQPLDLQRPLDQLVDLLVTFLGGRGVNQEAGDEDSPPLSSDRDSSSDELD